MTLSRLKTFLLCAVLPLAMLGGTPQQPAHQSVGLVLSGGGSKGIAHIGVIQALEDNDIPIDYITGTSMGAIVGGLYAAGYTPDEMLELILSRGFSYWSTGRIDPDLTYYFSREPASPAMFSKTFKSAGSRTDSVPASLISPLPMNFAFMELFAPYTAVCGGDFDRLFVPFRCVASDVKAHCKRVLGSGDLADAIRASMSFPIVFQATQVDSMLLYDGGIYDNFPVDVMRSTFAPDIMFGVTVNTPEQGPQNSIMDQLDNLVIQSSDYSLPDDEGVKLHIDLHRFSLLDFPKAREIYRIGYDHAMAMMDSLKTRITSRTPREVRELRRAAFKARLPYERFRRVRVTGGTPRQNEYIAYLFHPAKGCDTIGAGRARDAYYRAISSGKLTDLAIHSAFNDSTGLFDLDLKAAVKGSLRLAAGGYITSSTNSFLYLSGGYSSLSFRSVNASLSAWIGQSVMAGTLRSRMYLHTPVPSAIDLEVVASRTKYYETEHLFYEDKTPTFIINHEYFGRLGWSLAAGRSGTVSVGAGIGSLRSSYFRNNRLVSYEDGRDRSNYGLGQIFVSYKASTLDDENFPTAGYTHRATALAVSGRNTIYSASEPFKTHPKWLQAELRLRQYLSPARHFSLGIEGHAILSTRHLLPTYSATITGAPAFEPTAASAHAFNPAFRSYSFFGAGLVPIYRYNDNLSARIGAYSFTPIRQINRRPDTDIPEFGRWIGHTELWAEAAIAYRLPFGTAAAYLNYTTAPGDPWHVGLSLGIHILPPKFLRQ